MSAAPEFPLPDYDAAVSYHCKSVAEVQSILKTDTNKGLTTDDVQNRLAQFGLNQLETHNSKWWKILLAQFVNAMTLVLLIAMIVSFVQDKLVEAVVIVIVIITNSTVGFLQEFNAEKTMESLKNMSSPTAKVIRNISEVETIPARDLVPGDVVMLEEGDTCPADLRLVKVFHLKMDEALLTGESVPIEKDIKESKAENESIGDRKNLAYASSTVNTGRGVGIVVRTGMNTEIGKIAAQLKKSEDSSLSTKTPAQRSLMMLAYFLFGVVIILCIIVFSVNKWNITPGVASYAIAVSIAVIPEGLIAVMTITMALGTKKMATRKAIVRKLTALEALGSITNICSDKTGTLTQGKMVARKAFVYGEGYYDISGDGYRPVGGFKLFGENMRPKNVPDIETKDMSSDLKEYLKCGSLCNLSVIKRKGISKKDESSAVRLNLAQHIPFNESFSATNVEEWEAFGDPTEAAINVMAWKADMAQEAFTKPVGEEPPLYTLTQEFGFDSSLKRMSMVYQDNRTKKFEVFAKGAVETILNLSNSNKNGEFADPEVKGKFSNEILQVADDMAERGLRVLAMAKRTLAEQSEQEILALSRAAVEKDLTFLGLVGIYDPPRNESAAAIKECRAAGITIHMLTGDHHKTAETIAREIGIIPVVAEEGAVMKAVDFDAMTDEQMDALPELPSVIARCSPATKVKMVDALKRRHLNVAMTGDGTNDAPSLKKADVGIAMGLAGSDVAKSASDIVLTDDNFATIVKAIYEGRRIFANMQKFVLQLMSTNVAQVITLIIGLAFVDQSGSSIYPMSAVQILFLNMITSTPPAIALGVERGSQDLMRIAPRAATVKGAGIFTAELMIDIAFYGFFMGCFTLGAFSLSLFGNGGANPLGNDCNSGVYNPTCEFVYRARGTAFITMVLIILIHGYNCRHLRQSIITGKDYGGFKKIMSNRMLFWGVVVGVVLSIPTLYIPFINDQVFKQLPISWEWGPIIGFLVLFLTIAELYKLFKRRYYPTKKVDLQEILLHYTTEQA
ncbi:hypothetical protein MP638_003809 [Amoeboaphelidium occidentale]|nr:hypothetical protein MP638_003809 [Amoeboaphelidium occidentale]